MATKADAARNLPIIIFKVETGIVRRSSYDPVLNSSENSLIVTAGITNDKITGKSENIFLISACPNRKKVEKKNHPVSTRKIVITIYAIGDMKYPLNSFLKMLIVFFISIFLCQLPEYFLKCPSLPVKLQKWPVVVFDNFINVGTNIFFATANDI